MLLGSFRKDTAGTGYYLSAKSISVLASKYFKNVGGATGVTIIEHYPALTLKSSTYGPNGMQEYEVSDVNNRKREYEREKKERPGSKKRR